MAENTISNFIVLFTAQKTKKFKVWQDGTMKYYSFNKRLTLIDEKGYNIDRKFHKGGIPMVGDEIDFDNHIVTIESFGTTEIACNAHQRIIPNHRKPTLNAAPQNPDNPSPQSTYSSASTSLFTPTSSSTAIPSRYNQQPMRTLQFKPPSVIPRKRLIKVDPEEMEEENAVEAFEPRAPQAVQQPTDHPMSFESSIETSGSRESAQNQSLRPNSTSNTNQQHQQPSISSIPPATVAPPQEQPNLSESSTPASSPAKKRVRVGLSKKTTSVLHQVNTASSTGVSPYRPPTVASRSAATPTTTPSVTLAPCSPSFTKASNIGNNFIEAADTANLPPSTLSCEQNESSSSSCNGESNASKPFKSPFAEGNYTSLVLQFPNSKKALSIIKSKNYPKRSKVVPVKFSSTILYKETFRKVIQEHLDVLLLNFGMFFYAMYEKFGKSKQGPDLERALRSKGIGLYVDCQLKGDLRYSEKRFRLMIKGGSREHYSKYNKDDLWAISKVSTFESSQTFLARSTYFGPFSDGALEIDCMSPRDVRVAAKVFKESHAVYAIRTISASQECMMLDTLDNKLEQLPLLPHLLSNNDNKKTKKTASLLPELDCIRLTRQDNIDVDAKLADYIRTYGLNQDQESVLRQVARSVIVSPGWNEAAQTPFVLVHGVYGFIKKGA
ncbi:hypothetical protein BD408DRAFT_161434 [Parasitella parasitica]|nr:hypothetical protein BD408DRAFT_161434 [Parasitella parasitica]